MSGIRLDSYFPFWSNSVFLCDHGSSKPARGSVRTGPQLHPTEADAAGWLMLEGKRQGENWQPVIRRENAGEEGKKCQGQKQ